MVKQPVLEVNNLVKNFGKFRALSGVSFSVAEGEILGFLGPNGAGKSTTIFCILGLVEKDEGEIRIFGQEFAKNRSQILSKMNYASAEYNLPWNLTLWENLLVYAKLYAVEKPRERIRELLDLFEAGDFANRAIRDLSQGQRARANLCKALLNKPRLLLLDEPMASMDPDVVDRGIDLIRRVKKEEKMSILYTSHNMWEIEEIADRVIFLNHGKIAAEGTPLELTSQVLKLEAKEPNLREVFIEISRKAKEPLTEGETNL